MDYPENIILPSPIQRDEEGHALIMRNLTLRSVFQPILSISHRRVIGYEALLRASDAQNHLIPPPAILGPFDESFRARDIDRASRALHVEQFCALGLDPAWLFLNIHPGNFASAWLSEDIQTTLNIPNTIASHQVVLEVSEELVSHESWLPSATRRYSEEGFLVAIDDFGVGRANFDRIWQVKPDIVKLDRTLTAKAVVDRSSWLFIRNLIHLVHQIGAMVVAEGVETVDHAVALMEADVDFIQGFWFSYPKAQPAVDPASLATQLDHMWSLFGSRREKAERTRLEIKESHEQALADLARAFLEGGALNTVAPLFLDVPGAVRVFMTDHEGTQHAAGILSTRYIRPTSSKLCPVEEDGGTNWSRRHYFQSAMAHPGIVRTVGPHYSLTDGRDCYTSAIAVDYQGRRVVLCGDFFPPESEDR